jgi:hypothetical protein
VPVVEVADAASQAVVVVPVTPAALETAGELQHHLQ